MPPAHQELMQGLRDAVMHFAATGTSGDVKRTLDSKQSVIPLSIDFDGDVAAAALLGWSEQDSGLEPTLWKADLERRRGDWVNLGFSGGLPPESYPLTDREPAMNAGRHIRLWAGPDSIPVEHPRSPGWRSAAIKLSAEVDQVRVGDRIIRVPFHGYVAVAIRQGQPAVATALSGDRPVASIDLGRGAGELYRRMRHQAPGGWPLVISP
jgi:hypothetical protein